MDEDEIKKIKEQKKKEMQESEEAANQREDMEKKLEQQKKQALRKIMTKDARERLNRVKLADEAVAQQLETYLVQLSQSGQVREKIDEEKLKKILKSIKNETEQDWNIKRR
ncbi:MAG: DNA-binding protein [Candidatus Aenigmatarchaeota archaeon]